MIRTAKTPTDKAREWELRRRIKELEAELDRAYVAMTRLRACRCMDLDLMKAMEEPPVEGVSR
jgi:hypothetical protein